MQFVSTLWLDVANKLVEIFFEKDEAVKAKKSEERKAPTVDGLDKLANLVKVGCSIWYGFVVLREPIGIG